MAVHSIDVNAILLFLQDGVQAPKVPVDACAVQRAKRALPARGAPLNVFVQQLAHTPLLVHLAVRNQAI